jgi:transglutaminase-like putative cysteine protease
MSASALRLSRLPALATARRVASHATALAAFLALTTSGEMPSVAIALFLLGAGASLLKGDRPLPGMAPVLTILTAGLGVAMIFLVAQGTVDLVLGASLFAAALCLNRLLLRRSPADDPLLLLTTLLMLAAGAALSGEASYGVCFALYGLGATPALTFSHLERAADQAGLSPAARDALLSRNVIAALLGLAAVALLGAAAFFVLFPRVNAQWLGRHQGSGSRAPMVGFSDRVQLGGFGALRSDPRPALRVRFPGLDPAHLPARLLEPGDGRLALLWRGQSLDTFDGRAWSSGKAQRPRMISHDPPRVVDLHVAVEVLPVAGTQKIFSPGTPAAVKLVDRDPLYSGATRYLVRQLGNGDAELSPAPSGAYAYEVWNQPVQVERLRGAGRGYPTELVARDLQLPEPLDPRIPALARSWVGAATDPAEQAQALRDHLRRDYRYTTELPGEVPDPLASFLFERKAGHCEYFSTAMVVLLRTLGVPAREVTGFSGGVLAPSGEYFIVRAGDAHSWAEVYFPGQGFVAFDPTPSTASAQGPRGLSAWLSEVSDTISARWSAAVIDYDLRTQMGALQRVGNAFSRAAARFSRDPGAQRPLPWRRIALMLAGGLALALLLSRSLRLRRSKAEAPGDEAGRAFLELSRRLRRRGLPRAEHETVRELSVRLQKEQRPEALVVARFAVLYEGARYGGQAWGEAQRTQVRALLGELRG